MKKENGRFVRSLTADELSGSGGKKVKIKKEKQNKQKRSCERRDGCCMQKKKKKKKKKKKYLVERPITKIFFNLFLH